MKMSELLHGQYGENEYIIIEVAVCLPRMNVNYVILDTEKNKEISRMAQWGGAEPGEAGPSKTRIK